MKSTRHKVTSTSAWLPSMIMIGKHVHLNKYVKQNVSQHMAYASTEMSTFTAIFNYNILSWAEHNCVFYVQTTILCWTGPLWRPRCVSQCLFGGFIVTIQDGQERMFPSRKDVLENITSMQVTKQNRVMTSLIHVTINVTLQYRLLQLSQSVTVDSAYEMQYQL